MLLLVCITAVISCKNNRVEDKSLSLAEYMRSGMPDPYKIWRSHDFALANAVLENIKSTRPYNLPVKGSKKSGKIFDRMVSLENLNFLQDNRINLAQKLSLCNQYLKYCEDWIRLYTLHETGQQYYHRELAISHLFGLKITEIMLDLNDQLQLSGGDEDLDIEFYTDQVRSIYLSGLFNLIHEQSKISQFTEADLKLIADHVVESIENNRSWMDDTVRKDLRQMLQTVIDSTSLDSIESRYKDVMESL